MEDIAPIRHIIRANVHLVNDTDSRREIDQRIEMFVNDRIILGAPTWDLLKEHPYVSVYASLETYNLKVEVSSSEKTFVAAVNGLDTSVTADVYLIAVEKTALNITSGADKTIIFSTPSIPEQELAILPEDQGDIN
jgi:hypothetical protein